MKKKLLFILTLLVSFTLVSCGPGNIDNHTVVISKLYGASSMDNNLIELYNNSKDKVNLGNYTLDIYSNGSTIATTKIKLKGKIDANGYFAISSKNIENNVLKQVDQKLKNNLPYNGDDAVALSYKGEVIDVLGTIGLDIFFSRGLTLTRLGEKENFKPSNVYNKFDFIQYVPDNFKYLKNDNYTIKNLDDLLKGPELSFEYLNLPYSNGTLGTGGAPVADLQSVADGDTATFSFPGKNNSMSHRYYYVNTAEVYGTNTEHEPWGNVASKFNKQFILNDVKDKEIRIQSVPNSTLTDTYGRNLGLIWVDGKLSQFEIVSQGLSKVHGNNFNSTDMSLTYLDVPYLTFLLFAEERARENGWGLHGYPVNPNGEKAPDWNYETNSVDLGENLKNWQPKDL